ncbi:MAG: aminoglycoside phosphotransferase family protein [Myxococcales bacterium]|nr:aminoglycoside phosphotransferase family protein [Myxococcales bacterium]
MSDADLPEWIEERLGPVVLLDVRSRAYRIQPRWGPIVWIKHLRAGRAWAQADRAYRRVTPRLREAGLSVPRRLDRWPEQHALVLSDQPGRSARLTDAPEIFAAAGAGLALLHRLPCPEDPVPLPEALLQRARAWADRQGAPRAVGQKVVELVRTHAADLDTPRVWCHRDFQPQNWLIDGRGAWGLLDFEHTRPDHPLVDWVRLEARGWSPAQKAAFEEAYGAPDHVALRCMLAIYGLATLAWARKHRDVSLVEVGRAALQRAGIAGAGWDRPPP